MIFNSTKFGFDISTYQDDPSVPGTVDFDKMVSNGASFVIMRSSVGNLLDVDFQTFKANSRNKLPRAVYHYYWNNVSPITQAQLCLSAIGTEKFEGRVWLDLETTGAGAYTGWKHWKVFIETIQAAGLRVGIYTGYYWWKTNAVDAGADLSYFAQFPLWQAWYTSNAVDVLIARGWNYMMIWQHSSTGGGYAAGVESANIDQNKWNDQYNFNVEWGTVTPPPPQEIIMEQWKSLLNGLAVRSGANPANPPAYTKVQALNKDDVIDGVLDVAKNWIRIYKITRALTGTVLTPTTGEWWCSGLPAYVEKLIVTPPPPVVDSVTIDIVLHDVKVAGDAYIANGVKATKTA